jgi:hypothetical protein
MTKLWRFQNDGSALSDGNALSMGPTFEGRRDRGATQKAPPS